MFKRNLLAALLTVLNGALLLLGAFLWRSGQEHVHAPEHLQLRDLDLPDFAVLNAPAAPRLDVAAIRDNAVFHSRRSFYQAPAPAQAIPVPEYEFAGSMVMPQGKRVAFVKKKADQSNRTLHVGDDLEGWRVENIDAVRVLLVRNDQHAELKNEATASAAGLAYANTEPRVAHTTPPILGTQGPKALPPSGAMTDTRNYMPPSH